MRQIEHVALNHAERLLQEQAAALLNQLHQQEPGRAAKKQRQGLLGSAGLSHARRPRQQLLLTPGMGSVGSVSPHPLGKTNQVCAFALPSHCTYWLVLNCIWLEPDMGS